MRVINFIVASFSVIGRFLMSDVLGRGKLCVVWASAPVNTHAALFVIRKSG